MEYRQVLYASANVGVAVVCSHSLSLIGTQKTQLPPDKHHLTHGPWLPSPDSLKGMSSLLLSLSDLI